MWILLTECLLGFVIGESLNKTQPTKPLLQENKQTVTVNCNSEFCIAHWF